MNERIHPPLNLTRYFAAFAPAALIGIFLILAITSLARKNPTFDEVSHIPAGYAFLRTGEPRMNSEHPPLAKVLAGLPLMVLGLGDPEDFEGYAQGDQWRFGKAFLFENRVAADRITFWARIPLVLLAAALGLFVYRWSREIHGEVGGLVSLALFCLSPNLIAHGRLVTTDVPIALFSLLVAYFLWRNLKAPPGRLWWPYGLSLALAFLAKYSAIVLLPATVGVVLCWLWLDRPSRKDAGLFLRKFGVATTLPIMAVVVFGFGPTTPFAYVEGFRDALEKLNTEYLFYLAGEYSREGFYLYYLLAFALKTPIATLMILAISLLAIRRHPRLVLVSLALPALLFFLAPTLRRYNIGFRYILPIYPFLFVLAGGAISVPSPRGALRWATAVLLVWLAVGTLRAYPHYLPYFNEMAGGSPGGIRWLDDSNVDWGQDLKALGRVAREESLGRIGIIYHGTARPTYYLPDSYVPTRSEADRPRSGQVYAVSAHLALREGWLDRAKPFRIIGHTIYLYRFP